jgi:hypothetical protein
MAVHSLASGRILKQRGHVINLPKPTKSLIVFSLVGLAVVFAVGLVAILKMRAPESTDDEAAQSIADDRSPREVAEVLIQALEEGDTPTLLGLVAAKKATADIDAMFEKYGRRAPASMTGENAIKLVVAGWRLTYSFCQAGKTEITEEKIEGDTATVIARVIQRGGTPQDLVISLAREDNLWKVCPGLKSTRYQAPPDKKPQEHSE